MRAAGLLFALLVLSGCAVAGTLPPTPSTSGSSAAATGTVAPAASAPPSSAASPIASAAGPSPTPTAPVIEGVGPTFPPVVHGTPLAVGPKPDAAACERLIRDERQAAQAIRSGVAAELNGGTLASDPATVAAVAADRAASISPELGIPLTAAEERRVQAVGVWADPRVRWWVVFGHPERFGGYWIDRAGGRALDTVAIPPTDTTMIALARCLEEPRVRVQYVQAAITLALLAEVHQRISDDRDWLAAQGMGYTALGRRESLGRVPVGVRTPTPEIEAFYRARYGWPVLIEQGPSSVALW